MKHLETVRLRRSEQKVADAIALPIALVLSILFYLGKLAVKGLVKFKRILFKLSLFIFILYSLSNFFMTVAVAPKADASTPFIPTHPVTEHDQIVAYIKSVFGKYAGQAIQVSTCESGLRPNAVNDNTQWGGVGIDRGLFQLNSVYQGISNTNFLFDYHLNTDMAWIIFKNAGYNWHLWTCGRKLYE